MTAQTVPFIDVTKRPRYQAYRRALAALSDLRGCEVWYIGRPWNRSVASLDRLTNRAIEAKRYQDETGDRVGAGLYLDGWSWDMVTNRPDIIGAAEVYRGMVVDAHVEIQA